MRETSASKATGHFRGGFTLLEILIALALVAILLAAALPFLRDSFSSSEGDRAADSIAARVLEERAKAMDTGISRTLDLTPRGIAGSLLPEGWKLEIKGLNDARFRAPSPHETWSINKAGLCEPLVLRLTGRDHEIILPFDALTGQVLHDHE